MKTTGNKRFDAALNLLEDRRFVEAVEAFSELVALNPDLVGAYGNRGLAYLNLGMDDKAYADFQTVLQLDPDDAMGHSMMAEISRFRGSPTETLEHVAAALELDEEEPQAYFIRGWLFAKAGQYQMAEEDLSRFIDLSGDNEEVSELLEACMTLAGDDPRDDYGRAMDSPEKIDKFLGRRGWSFNEERNPDHEAEGFPCPYAHCIRNRPPQSPDTPDGCPVFGYSCPGQAEQTAWCREHPDMFE